MTDQPSNTNANALLDRMKSKLAELQSLNQECANMQAQYGTSSSVASSSRSAVPRDDGFPSAGSEDPMDLQETDTTPSQQGFERADSNSVGSWSQRGSMSPQKRDSGAMGKHTPDDFESLGLEASHKHAKHGAFAAGSGFGAAKPKGRSGSASKPGFLKPLSSRKEAAARKSAPIRSGPLASSASAPQLPTFSGPPQHHQQTTSNNNADFSLVKVRVDDASAVDGYHYKDPSDLGESVSASLQSWFDHLCSADEKRFRNMWDGYQVDTRCLGTGTVSKSDSNGWVADPDHACTTCRRSKGKKSKVGHARPCFRLVLGANDRVAVVELLSQAGTGQDGDWKDGFTYFKDAPDI